VGVDSARYADWIHIYMGDSNADLISNSWTSLTRQLTAVCMQAG